MPARPDWHPDDVLWYAEKAIAGLRRPLALGVVIGLLVLGGGLGYTAWLPTTYSATSVFSLVPRPDGGAPADTVKLIAGAYVAYLASPAVSSRVAQAQGGSRDGSATEVSVDTGTANVRIRVTLPEARRAADVANALSAAAAAKAAGDRLVVVDLVSPAEADAAETNPPRRLLVLSSALAAVLAGAVVGVVAAYRRAS